MKTKDKLFESTGERKVSFAIVILAFSLFGFLWPHHANTANKRRHIERPMQKDSQTQTTAGDWDHDEDGVYTPTLRQGWSDLHH
jgi:hypothetical protein